VVHLTEGRASKRPLTAVRVLSALFAMTPAGTPQKPHKRWQIAQEARITAADASRALRDLEGLGVVARSGRGPATSFVLRPASDFMGQAVLPPEEPGVVNSKMVEVHVRNLGTTAWGGPRHGQHVDED
jgi:hypothetical protein